MKKPITVLVLFLFAVCACAQKNSNTDTLTNKTVVPGRWAIELDLGASMFNAFKASYASNTFATNFNYKIFYRNFFYNIGMNMCSFSPSKDLRLNNYVVSNQDRISLMSMNIALGYLYNFNKKWGADIKLGGNMSDLEILYDNEFYTFKPQISDGTYIGLGINRYFKLKGYNYIVLSLGADYCTSDYSKKSPDMNKQTINYALTVGYKGFSKRVLKQ